MQHNGNQITGINIAYIGGGSRGWAWGLMSDLAMEEQLAGNVRLYDTNFEAAYANEIIGNKLSQKVDIKSRWEYKAVNTLEEALSGADFVVISILPGTFKEMESDVHLPEKYGIYQAVGDTVGPAGIIRALRTVPMYVDIAEAIRAYSPEAWVINYTNPMTICTRTLYEVFPKIKAFGCCHEVFGTQNFLAQMLMKLKGITNVNRSDIKVNVLGINHFTWLDKAEYNGIDIFPLYEEAVNKYNEEGYAGNETGHWMNSSFGSADKVKFDLFRRYGLIAAAGDRHLAEFCPPWYLKDRDTAKRWGFELTPVNYRIENLEKRIARGKKLMSGEEQFSLQPTGEEGVDQIKAILGLGDIVTNVNLPNVGQISGLPFNAVVETNALFSRNSVVPVMAGKLPEDVNILVLRHVINQETTLKAALIKNKDLAFRAFVNDPLMTANLDDAKILFEEMLINTKNYLPGWEI